jgi:serine/threonine protein kinase
MDFDTLPVSAAQLVDRVCLDFENASSAGENPRIEDYLADKSAPVRSALFQALLASELRSRRELGEQPEPEEYLSRFPAEANVINVAFGKAPLTVAAGVPSPSALAPAPAPAAEVWDGSISVAGSNALAGTKRSLPNATWAWPLIGAAILAIAGWRARSTVERVMKAQIASELLALRDADVESLNLLFEAQKAVASIAANDPRIRASVRNLLARGNRDTGSLLRSHEHTDLREALGPWLGQYEYDGFRILDRQGHSIASWRDVTVGGPAAPEEIECLDAVFAGKATVSRPRPSEVLLPDVDGNERVGLPTMFVLAPIRGDDGQTIAALGFRMRPERTFTRVLNVGRFGRSGETFAFDRSGLLLSESRFDDELKRIGLITDAPYVRSILSLHLQDPGVDLTRGARSSRQRGTLPLTRLVAEALQGQSGVDVNGDRDYRGVPVIGAWTWLPEYGFGVVTKVDRAEAFQPLTILQTAFWSLFALLAAAAITLFIFTLLMARLRRRVRLAALAVKQLGRYTLDSKIGEGGMGVVYRAHHAMLRRPTAIKLLLPAKTNEKSIARFEREVQSTSQLTHPNTVTIYDYGRTSDGLFYYAMEYLDGIDLQSLVAKHGPQPEARVIHILQQVCGSLVEAHGIGLIHRDIKPSNIVITRRGNLFDFAKLLDFGLVKAIDGERLVSLTPTGSIVGTPHYIAPEVIRFPNLADARSDLYAVGAVAYFLLSGRRLFEGHSVAEILFQQVSAKPEPLSSDTAHPISPDLESLVASCLAKNPADRPPSALALAESLGRLNIPKWSSSDATSWWQSHFSAARAQSPVNPLRLSSSDADLFGRDPSSIEVTRMSQRAPDAGATAKAGKS